MVSRDGVGIMALKNSTTAQTFRVYGTTTGPKYVQLSHDGTNGNLDTAASSGTLSLGSTNATSVVLASASGGAVIIGGSGKTTGIHLQTAQQTAPTVTTNGGTSPSCTGTDTAMYCTIGTAPPAAATFTVTFKTAWSVAPACVAMRNTAGTTPAVTSASTGTGTVQITLSANLVASEIYNIICMGVQ